MTKITASDVLEAIRQRNRNTPPTDLDKLERYTNQVMMIDYHDIDPSAVNNSGRIVEDDRLDVLVNSILENGLYEPLRVYERHGLGYLYTIISGHRRYAAVKYINEHHLSDKFVKIPCYIVHKPKDILTEKIEVTMNNASRKAPIDLVNEVRAASELWKEICDLGKKKEYTDGLFETFCERNKGNPNYIADPDRFIRNNYRIKLEFIRKLTGLEMSNNTIRRCLIQQINKDSSEEPLNPREFVRPKVLTTRHVVKKIDVLKKYVTNVVPEIDPDAAAQIMQKCGEIEQILDHVTEEEKNRGEE